MKYAASECLHDGVIRPMCVDAHDCADETSDLAEVVEIVTTLHHDQGVVAIREQGDGNLLLVNPLTWLDMLGMREHPGRSWRDEMEALTR
jgi:hypothetical protein